MEQEIMPTEAVMSSKKLLAKTCRIGFCVVMVMFTGCTRVYDIDSGLQTYPGNEKVNLSVVLILNQELYNSVFEWKSDSYLYHPFQDTCRIKIGKSLAKNAEGVVRAVFREVTIVRPNEGGTSPQGIITLTPRLMRAERISVLSKVTHNISIEWTLMTAKEEIIWVKEIGGTENSKLELSAIKQSLKNTQSAILDVFRNSCSSMSSAHEIKAFAATQGVTLNK
jgi:hypothetical protein